MSKSKEFICEGLFLERPEFSELVNRWGEAFDDLESSGRIDEEGAIEEVKRTLEERSREIIEQHSPPVIEALVVGNLDEPRLWVVRAMLMANEIRESARKAKPKDFSYE